MVFQSYALYPHMNVRENLRFGLVCQKLPKAEIEARIRRAADILQIAQLLERKPAQLSGGQSQRVAIGRAIVKEPKAFLFDEPLSNLDAELRVRMRSEIVSLHRRLGSTIVFVTHDQVEAMTMADRIVVLRDGVTEQAGTPIELYARPCNRFVAGFLGAPQMNMLSAASHGNRHQWDCGHSRPEAQQNSRSSGRIRVGDRTVVRCRSTAGASHSVGCRAVACASRRDGNARRRYDRACDLRSLANASSLPSAEFIALAMPA